jgi:tRNA synthetases class II core domain (F)
MDIEPPEQFERSILESSFIKYPLIDWGILHRACLHYSSLGYQQKETPWVIPENYGKTTKPHIDKSFVHNNDMFKKQAHELVGSAEQGFIYLLLNNLLPKGKYFSVSPCFRVDNYDSTHLPWFMKLELLIYSPENEDEYLKSILNDAFNFLNINSDNQCEIVSLEDGTYDINLNGLEIGSYGIRNIENIKYIYGTGIALPRFNVANKNE